MENKENIDKLFKESLLEPDIPFNEQDWEKMSGMLDLEAKRRRPTWLLWASAAAAILLFGLFVLFFNSEKNGVVQNKSAKIKRQQPVQHDPATQNKDELQEQYTKSQRKPSQEPVIQKKDDHGLQQEGSTILTELHLTPAILEIQPANPGRRTIPFDAHLQVPAAAKDPADEEYAKVVKDVKKKMNGANSQKQGLTLSAMLAPDISYAESSIGSKVSSNVGLLATYGISPKLSLTSGAIYSNKYYNSYITGVNAYNLSGEPYDINAVCNVIDIPLNVNYKLLDKKKFSLAVNAGLSSYLMLREKYDYVYPQEGSSPSVVSVEYRNQNQHFFGIANVAVSVERKISPRLSIGVQPFMKLPLTGIGAGDASLRSSGMSFSLNMSLFPAKKPGRFAGLRQFGSQR